GYLRCSIERKHLVTGADDGIVGDGSEVSRETGDDRSVHCGADREVDVLATCDLDGLLAHLQRNELAVPPVLVALYTLDVQVRHVSGEVGEAPRDLRVVPDDDPGQT